MASYSHSIKIINSEMYFKVAGDTDLSWINSLGKILLVLHRLKHLYLRCFVCNWAEIHQRHKRIMKFWNAVFDLAECGLRRRWSAISAKLKIHDFKPKFADRVEDSTRPQKRFVKFKLCYRVKVNIYAIYLFFKALF